MGKLIVGVDVAKAWIEIAIAGQEGVTRIENARVLPSARAAKLPSWEGRADRRDTQNAGDPQCHGSR